MKNEKKWKPGFLFYLVVAIIVYTIFELFTTKTNTTDERVKYTTGWTEAEINEYMKTCKATAKIAQEQLNLDDYEVHLYCTCTYREILELFPEGPPELRELKRDAVEMIASKCLEMVLEGQK